MKNYRRTIIAVRGDTQGGHSGGLVNPETKIPDLDIDENGNWVVSGYRTPDLRPIQRQLWKWHTQDIKDVRKLADKDEIVFLEMGDLTQGGFFKDDIGEIGLAPQVIISQYNCMPWLEIPNVKRMRICKGTSVHLWSEAATETILTTMLSQAYPKKSIKITDHWLLDLDGFLMDIAHHGPGAGIRNWTRGNVFELYAKSLLKDDIEAGNRPPNIVLRAHKHEFIYRRAIHQVRDRIWELPAFISPPYCFIGGHAQKVCSSPSYMGVGVLALEVINGKLFDYHPFTHYIDLRVRESI